MTVQTEKSEQPVEAKLDPRTLLGMHNMHDKPKVAKRRVDIRAEKEAALKWIQEQMRKHSNEIGRREIEVKLDTQIDTC